MPDGTKLDGMSSPQADLEGEGKLLQQVTRETTAHTRAMQQNSRAVQDNSQAWGRLRKEQETYLDRLKNIGRITSDITNGMMGTQQAVSGFANKMKQATTVTGMFERKLDAMRKGQAAYAGSMVATTGNISKAMDESQKYVTAVHDSYRSANKMAAKYRVTTEAAQKAVVDLNARFQTQIAVSGNVTGAIEGMREEAFLMGKYLGTTMEDVMDSWNERLQQSTLTLDEAKNEMVRVTYQADKYAQAIGDLGDQYLKTGNIGKKEFVQMVRDVGKQFSHGTVQIDGYAAALQKVLVKSKKMKMSAQEQRGISQGLGKMTQSMFAEGGGMSLFGMKAASRARQRMEAGDGWLEKQDPALQARMRKGMEATKGEHAIVKDRMMMSIMAASNKGNAMGMRLMQEIVESKSLGREMIAKEAGVGLYQAEALREMIQSGEAANTFDKAAAEDDKQGKEDQTEIWKKSLEDVAKAAMTPKNVEYKIVAGIHEVKKTIEYWAKASIAASVGTQVLGMGAKGIGHLVARRAAQQAALRGGGQVAARGGTSLLGGLFGGGAAAAAPGAAALPGSAGFIGPVAPAATGGAASAAGTIAAGSMAVAGSFVAGYAAGTYLDQTLGKHLGTEREKKIAKLEGDQSISGHLSRGGSGKLSGALGSVVWGDKFDEKGWDMIQKERVLLEGQEFQDRKDLIKVLKKSVENMEASERDLTLVEREKLKTIKKQLEQAKGSIKKRTDQEKKESTEADKRLKAEATQRVGTWLGQAAGGKDAKATAKRLMNAKLAENQYGFAEPVVTGEGDVAQNILANFARLPKDVQAKFGDIEAVAKEAKLISARRKLYRETDLTKDQAANLSTEQTNKMYKTKFGETLSTPELSKFTDRERKRQALQALVPGAGEGSEDTGGGIAGISSVTTNVKGEFVFTLPGRKVILKGAETGMAKLQHDKEKNG